MQTRLNFGVKGVPNSRTVFSNLALKIPKRCVSNANVICTWSLGCSAYDSEARNKPLNLSFSPDSTKSTFGIQKGRMGPNSRTACNKGSSLFETYPIGFYFHLSTSPVSFEPRAICTPGLRVVHEGRDVSLSRARTIHPIRGKLGRESESGALNTLIRLDLKNESLLQYKTAHSTIQ